MHNSKKLIVPENIINTAEFINYLAEVSNLSHRTGTLTTQKIYSELCLLLNKEYQERIPKTPFLYDDIKPEEILTVLTTSNRLSTLELPRYSNIKEIKHKLSFKEKWRLILEILFGK